MAKSYREHLQELRGLNIQPKSGDFHDYEAFLIEQRFEEFYQLAQNHLDREDHEVDIRHGKFYYTDNTGVNAAAWKHDNSVYVIEMCQGAMRLMYNFFVGQSHKFDQSELQEYKEVIEKRGIDPGYFMFQFITSYFLYHEAGHLIQLTQGDIDYEENPAAGSPDDQVPTRHIRELDADWYAAHCMAMIVKQFAQGKGAENAIVTEEVFLIASLALATIYTYYIKLNTLEFGLYYNKQSHPHPSVRLSYIVMFLLQNLDANVERMDQGTILKRAIQISQILLKTDDSDIVEKYSKKLYENMNAVEAYINKIISDSDAYPYLSKKAFETLDKLKEQ